MYITHVIRMFDSLNSWYSFSKGFVTLNNQILNTLTRALCSIFILLFPFLGEEKRFYQR